MKPQDYTDLHEKKKIQNLVKILWLNMKFYIVNPVNPVKKNKEEKTR